MIVSASFECCSSISAENYTNSVTILDARKHKLTSTMFKNAVGTLPVYDGTVPMDSLMLVCYSNTSYVKDKIFSVNHNLLWAAVLYGEDSLVIFSLSYGLINFARLIRQ